MQVLFNQMLQHNGNAQHAQGSVLIGVVLFCFSAVGQRRLWIEGRAPESIEDGSDYRIGASYLFFGKLFADDRYCTVAAFAKKAEEQAYWVALFLATLFMTWI